MEKMKRKEIISLQYFIDAIFEVELFRLESLKLFTDSVLKKNSLLARTPLSFCVYGIIGGEIGFATSL